MLTAASIGEPLERPFLRRLLASAGVSSSAGVAGLLGCWDQEVATLLRSDTRRFSRSVPLARQGVLALSLQMEPRWGKGWRLLLFNCHFTILGGDDARRSNITELVRSRTRRSASVLQCALLIVFYDTGPEQEVRRPALSAR